MHISSAYFVIMEPKEPLAASRPTVVENLLSSPGDQIPKDTGAERKVVRVSDTHEKAEGQSEPVAHRSSLPAPLLVQVACRVCGAHSEAFDPSS